MLRLQILTENSPNSQPLRRHDAPTTLRAGIVKIPARTRDERADHTPNTRPTCGARVGLKGMGARHNLGALQNSPPNLNPNPNSLKNSENECKMSYKM